MKARSLLIPAAIGFILVLILLAVLKGNVTALEADVRAPNVPAAELHVCPAGPPDCDHTSIQAAVNVAGSGSIIKVATGVYTDVYTVRLAAQEYVTQVVYLTGTITIRGGYTTTNWTTSEPVTYPTTLDAQGQGRVFYIAAGAASTIEDLHITGGDAIKGDPVTTSVGTGRGGGVYAVDADITLRNNFVFGNTSDFGGGLFLRRGKISLIGNIVSSNTAQHGGGVYFSEGVGEATFEGNTFTSNVATGSTTRPSRGGGLLIFNSGTAILRDNDVNANVAAEGGGLYLHRSSEASLKENAIIANAAAEGGGLYLLETDATLVNNVIANNDVITAGGGLYIIASYPVLFHTTIARNSGDGIYVTSDGEVELVNTILSTHTTGIAVEEGGIASLDATLWHGNGITWSGTVAHTNDRSGDPYFADPDAGDYHIGSESAALDQGLYVGVNVDMDGDERPRGHGYDIGPDEYPDFLSVVKDASPTPARAGEQLIYVIRITNYGGVTYTATITDILPEHVTYTGVITSWMSETLEPEPDYPWVGLITVTVEAGYRGLLTNTVEVVGIYEDERETGAARHITASFAVYLPLVLRTS